MSMFEQNSSADFTDFLTTSGEGSKTEDAPSGLSSVSASASALESASALAVAATAAVSKGEEEEEAEAEKHTFLTPFRKNLLSESQDAITPESNGGGGGKTTAPFDDWQIRVDVALKAKDVKALVPLMRARAHKSTAISALHDLLFAIQEQATISGTAKIKEMLRRALLRGRGEEIVRRSCYYKWGQQLLLIESTFVGAMAAKGDGEVAAQSSATTSRAFQIVMAQLFDLASDGKSTIGARTLQQYFYAINDDARDCPEFSLESCNSIVERYGFVEVEADVGSGRGGGGLGRDGGAGSGSAGGAAAAAAAAAAAGAGASGTGSSRDLRRSRVLDERGFSAYYADATRSRTRGVLREIAFLGFDCEWKR